MSSSFLPSVAVAAVTAFVEAKAAGKSDAEAAAAARSKLTARLRAEFDASADAARWKPLALPLSDLREDGDGLAVALLDPTVKSSAQSGGWDWSFSANASLRLVADVLDADQREMLGIALRDGFQVVRYAVEGELGAKLGGGTQAGIWSLQAGADASAQAKVEWYIAGRHTDYLGIALARAVPFMAPPMSLAQLLERAGDHEFWGVTTELQGTATASFGASAAVSGAGWTWGFDGDRPQVVLSLGASVNATLSVEGRFRLRCLPRLAGTFPDGRPRYGLEVTLERLSTSERTLAAEISAGLDLSALAQSADRWLKASLPNPSALLDTLTNPAGAISAKLQQKLKGALGQSKFKDLVLLAAGYGNQAQLADQLAQKAVDPLVDEIDKLVDQVLDGAADPKALTQRWLKRLLGPIDVPATVLADLESLVAELTADAQAELKGAAKTLADQLKGKAVGAVSALLAPLGLLGERVQAALQTAAGAITANQAAQAIKAAIGQYAAMRTRVLGVLADAQRAKLGLAISGSWEVTRKNQTFFRATLVPGGDPDAAQRLFQALWCGRFTDIRALLADAQASLYVPPEGWLLSASKAVSTQRTDIHFFGVTLSQVNSVVREMELKVDLAGNLVGVGKASAEAETNNRWRRRHAILAVTAIRRSLAGRPVVDLGFDGAYSASGEEVSVQFLEGMGRTLARVSGEAGSIDLGRQIGAPDPGSTEGRSFYKAATFLLPVTVTADEIAAYLSASASALDRAVTKFGLRALDAEYDGRVHEQDAPSRYFLQLAQSVGGVYDSELDRAVAHLGRFPGMWYRTAADLDNAVFERLGVTDPAAFAYAHARLRPLYRLSRMMRAMRSLQAGMRTLSDVMLQMDGSDLDKAQAAAREPLSGIAAALDAFAVSSSTLVGNREMVSWPFATFAAAFAELVGRPVPPGFTSCVVVPGARQPIPLLPL